MCSLSVKLTAVAMATQMDTSVATVLCQLLARMVGLLLLQSLRSVSVVLNIQPVSTLSAATVIAMCAVRGACDCATAVICPTVTIVVY